MICQEKTLWESKFCMLCCSWAWRNDLTELGLYLHNLLSHHRQNLLLVSYPATKSFVIDLETCGDLRVSKVHRSVVGLKVSILCPGVPTVLSRGLRWQRSPSDVHPQVMRHEGHKIGQRICGRVQTQNCGLWFVPRCPHQSTFLPGWTSLDAVHELWCSRLHLCRTLCKQHTQVESIFLQIAKWHHSTLDYAVWVEDMWHGRDWPERVLHLVLSVHFLQLLGHHADELLEVDRSVPWSAKTHCSQQLWFVLRFIWIPPVSCGNLIIFTELQLKLFDETFT